MDASLPIIMQKPSFVKLAEKKYHYNPSQETFSEYELYCDTTI